MKTLDALLKHYGRPAVPLEEVAGELLGTTAESIIERGRRHKAEVPFFRVTPRGKPMVRLRDVAKVLDKGADQALREFEAFSAIG